MRRHVVAVPAFATLALAIAAASGGCTLLTPLDDLTSGSSGAPSTTPDATPADATAADAAGPTDGGGTDGDGGDGATDGGDLCAGATFCDRFERNDPQGPWTTLYTQDSATLSIDTSTSTSPTRSLKMFVPSGGNARAFVQYEPGGTSSVLRARFSMTSPASPDREIQLVRLQLSTTDRAALVFLAFLPGKVVVAEQIYENGMQVLYADYPLMGVFTPGKWQSWSIALDATGPKARLDVSVDGKAALGQTLSGTFVRGQPSITFGALYLVAGASRDVWFDDVALDVPK